MAVKPTRVYIFRSELFPERLEAQVGPVRLVKEVRLRGLGEPKICAGNISKQGLLEVATLVSGSGRKQLEIRVVSIEHLVEALVNLAE